MRVRSGVDRRTNQMLKANLRRRILLDVLSRLGLAGVAVQRGASATRHNLVDAMLTARVGIPFDPVLEQVLVTHQQQLDMMLAEERHVPSSQRSGLNLDRRSAVRP